MMTGLSLPIKTAGEFTSVDQIANTSVAVYDGSVIRVKDVARVEDGFSRAAPAGVEQ